MHTFGVASVFAETAAKALQKATIPLGFRDAQAVVAADMVLPRGTVAAPFTALIGRSHGKSAQTTARRPAR